MVCPSKKQLFPVERQEAVLVKPSAPSPTGLLSLSSIDADPNLNIICQSVYVYSAGGELPPACVETNDGEQQLQHSADVWLVDPASAIKEGLAKALAYYYPLAGRLRRDEDGRLQVDCTGEGVPFSSATAACTLASMNYLEGVDLEEAKQLVIRGEGAGDGLLLMMQVTRFACGGFTVGLGLSHAVCDGFGSMQFMRAVAEIAGGASQPSVTPVWDRERLLAATATAPEWAQPGEKMGFLATSPHLPSDDLVNGRFDVDASTIERLKKALKMEEEEESGGEVVAGFTALDALGAYLWRSRFRALEMDAEGTTHFVLSVSIRRDAMDPPLPEGYYGNAFVGSHAFLSGRELCELPLWRTAAAIRETKRKAQEAAYVAPYLEAKEWISQSWKILDDGGASLLVTDWRRLGLAGARFGGQQAVNVVPLPWDMFCSVSICILMPPFSLNAAMKGGIRILMCLPKAAMARFEEEMAALSRLPT